MAVGRAHNWVVELGINVGNVELRAYEVVPRLLPGFSAFNDL